MKVIVTVLLQTQHKNMYLTVDILSTLRRYDMHKSKSHNVKGVVRKFTSYL